MIINKVIEICNLGKFRNYHSGSKNWDGTFKKVTAIYADNGSGKTTFTQIFKSLKGDELELFQERISLGSLNPILVTLLDAENKQIKYINNLWSQTINNIEVFDAYYVEDNVYVIKGQNGFFNILIGTDLIDEYKELKKLNSYRDTQKYLRTRLNKLQFTKYKLRSMSRTDQEKDEIRNEFKKIYQSIYRIVKNNGFNITSHEMNFLHNELEFKTHKNVTERISNSIKHISSDINKIEGKIASKFEEIGKRHLEKINEYLTIISPELQITKLNKIHQICVYHIMVDKNEVRTDNQSKSLSRTLSEGEKNALAFAFFLAKLDLEGEINKKMIVFDDPITSLDSKRRNVTISILSKIARTANQFILLSHDINFVKDFTERNSDALNLKIINASNTSIFVPQDIEEETLTGIFKDLKVLNDYIQNGESSEYGIRDVVRCIRPILEGFFRIKYYNHLKKTDWLGDIIKYIRDANEDDVLFQQKDNIDSLIDINDYSKTYHHSNPYSFEVPLNAEELRIYCQRTLDLLMKL